MSSTQSTPEEQPTFRVTVPAAAPTPNTETKETSPPVLSEEAKQRAIEAKARKAVKVPNVRPKGAKKDEVFDKKLLEESLTKMAASASIVLKDRHDETEVFVFESKEGKTELLKDVPTLYFKNCVNGHYTINRRTKNIFIDNCTNCTFLVNTMVLTHSCEIWNGGDNTIHINCLLKTIQVDLITGVNLVFNNWKNFHSLIHNTVEGLNLSFTDANEFDLKTGHSEMLLKYPDSNQTDQFIVRFVEGVLLVNDVSV